MNKLFQNLMVAALLLSSTIAFAQIDVPQPSPEGSVMSKVGLVDVSVDYFRPKKKGREIFGEGDKFLVPYGQTWRTGANQGTVVSFSSDIKFGGADVKAGEYLLFTVPGAESWDVMLYSDLKIGGNVAAYDEANEVARVKASVTSLSNTVETLTINISDISEDNKSANLEIAWANVSAKVSLATDYDAAVMESITKNTVVNPRNLLIAANYYYETDRDLEQALAWINTYLEANPNQFWNVHLKAQILAKKGDKKEAIATAEKSMQMAKDFPQGDFGYIKRNEDLIASLK